MAGVAFFEPRPSAVPGILRSIEQAAIDHGADVPVGATGVFDLKANEQIINAAVATKTRDGWSVQVWVGKTWAEPGVHYGAHVRRIW